MYKGNACKACGALIARGIAQIKGAVDVMGIEDEADVIALGQTCIARTGVTGKVRRKARQLQKQLNVTGLAIGDDIERIGLGKCGQRFGDAVKEAERAVGMEIFPADALAASSLWLNISAGSVDRCWTVLILSLRFRL